MAIKSIQNEKSILEKVAQGDQHAFTLLFDFYYKGLRSYIFRITESQEATEELVQEIFIKVWERRSQLSEIKSFKSYLFVLSRNKTLNYLRDSAKARANELKWQKNQFESSYLSDEPALEDEYNRIIDETVSDLPPQQLKVYSLSRHENLKYEEIAQKMGLSKETVKKHMHHALTFLKHKVKEKIENVVGLFILTFSLPLFCF